MTRLLLLASEFPPFRGGIATYAHELAVAASADGHEVVVAAPDYHADQSAADATLPYRVVRFSGGPATMRALPRRVGLVRRLLRAERFDIVHAADWPFFIPVRLARRARRARILLTLHGTEILYMNAPKRRRVLGLLRFWTTGWATWIANSAFTRELALATLPIDQAAIRAVPLGVSGDWIAARPDRAAARARFGTHDRHVLVSLGRVVPRKGHAVLADALALLPAPMAGRIDWWIIGPLLEPAYAELLRGKLKGLASRAELLGQLPADEVKQRIAASDLFCLPGYAEPGGPVEGFGLVFLEAAAYAVPAVATRSGGIPDAVADGVTGLLVAEQDAVALAGAIAALLADEPRRARMGEAAADRARGMTWREVMIRTYEP